MREISKRISIILLCMCCLATLSYTQSNAKYSYQLSETKSLTSVLDDLSKKYGLVFSYPSLEIGRTAIKAGQYSADDLDTFIGALLSQSELTFQVVDSRKVLLRPNRKESALSSNPTSPVIIRGKVLDNQNRPLPYVNIALDTLLKGATTNDDGFFSFEIPAYAQGRNLKFHFIGYEPQVIVVSDFLKNPLVHMRESTTQLDEVLFIEHIPPIQFSPIYPTSSTMSSSFLNGIAASPFGNDIMRSVQMLAGISATDDMSSAVKIRGGQSDETLIVLDGIPIYKADHFYGIYGAVNGNHVNQVSLHKNSLPVSFGGKTAGMLEMSSKDYLNNVDGALDLNTLTSSLSLSTPLGSRAGIILSGRTTYDNAAESKLFNWIDPPLEEDIIAGEIEERPLILETDPIIQFYDLNAKLYFRPVDNHLIQFSFFASQDDYNNSYDITFENRLPQREIRGREEFSDMDSWENLGTSLQYDGQLNNNWTINSRLYYTAFDSESAFTSNLALRENNETALSKLDNSRSNTIQDLGGFVSTTKKIGDDNLTLGLSAVRHDLTFSFFAANEIKFNAIQNGTESALFGVYDWQIDDQWKINLGGRLNHYSGTDQLYFGPRISTAFKANDRWTLKGSYAQHYQFLREVTHYTKLREPIEVFLLTSDRRKGRTYPVGTSTTTMLGAIFQKDQWTLDVELYNKDLTGVVEHTQQAAGRNPTDPDATEIPDRPFITVVGNGKSYGMDISLGYSDKAFAAWLAYTLSKTTNNFEDIFQGADIPSEDDRRHQLKLTNKYEINNWTFTGNYVFASGKSQLNLQDALTEINLRNILQPDSYSRLPAYHRVDIGVEYGFDIGTTKAAVGLNVFNLTNNQNVEYIQYLYSVPRRFKNQTNAPLAGTTTSL